MNQLTFGLGLDELLALDKELFLVLEKAFVLAQEELTKLAHSERFNSVIAQAFGEAVDAEAVEEIRRQWVAGEFVALPEVRVLSAEELPGARGAYAKELNTVFLSQEFLARSRGNVGEIVGVLLEEYGHFVDTRVNEVDTVGDEGEIFSDLVRRNFFSTYEFKRSREENDLKNLQIDDSLYEAEFSDNNIQISGKVSWIIPDQLPPSLYPVSGNYFFISEDLKKPTIGQSVRGVGDQGRYETSLQSDKKSFFVLEFENEFHLSLKSNYLENKSFSETLQLINKPEKNESLFKHIEEESFLTPEKTVNIIFELDLLEDGVFNQDLQLLSFGTGISFAGISATYLRGDKPDQIKLYASPLDKLKNQGHIAFDHTIKDPKTEKSFEINVISFDQDLNPRDWDGLYHEYGHYLAMIDGLDPFERNKAYLHDRGISNVGKYSKLEGTQLAWSEGIADYIGTALQHVNPSLISVFIDDPSFKVGDTWHDILPSASDTSYTSFDLETNQWRENGLLKPKFTEGEGDELAVSRILWDIADEKGNSKTENHDTVQLGHRRLYEILRKVSGETRNLDTLNALWDYFYANPNEIDPKPVNDSEDKRRVRLGRIFQEYNVSPSPEIPGEVINPGIIPKNTLSPTFVWKLGNNSANDIFKVIIFDEAFENRILETESLIKEASGGQGWTDVLDSEKKPMAGFAQWTLTSEYQDQWEKIRNSDKGYYLVVAGHDAYDKNGSPYLTDDSNDLLEDLYWSGAVPFAVGNGKVPETIAATHIRKIVGPAKDTLSTSEKLLEVAEYTGPFLGKYGLSNLNPRQRTANIADDSLSIREQHQLSQQTITDDSQENFLTQINASIDKVLDQLGTYEDGVPVTEAQGLFYEELGSEGLGFAETPDDIAITETAEELRFSFDLGADGLSFQLPLEADFGVPGLGLKIEEGSLLDLDFGFDFKFDFGLKFTEANPDGEFFFETPSDEDLKIALKAAIPDLDLEGQLGFLKVNIKDEDADDDPDNNQTSEENDPDIDGDGVNPSSLDLGFVFDLDISEGDLEVKSWDTTGSADINLDLTTSFDKDAKLPKISTGLDIDWEFDEPDSTPNVTFNDVQLDLGSFFTNVAHPVLDTIGTITTPIKPLVDILEADIGEKLGGLFSFSLLDIGRDISYNGQPVIDDDDYAFIKAISQVLELAENVPTDSNLIVNLGSFNLGNHDVSDPDSELSEADTYILSASSLDTTPLSDSENKFIASLETTDGSGLQFPILTDPKTAFDLLLGKQVDLFTYDMPKLDFNFSYESPPVPILGPLVARLEGEVGAQIDLGFGYDSSGIEVYAKGPDEVSGTADDYQNLSDIFNGFYIADGSITELELETGLKGKAALELLLFSAEVWGGIFANLGLDFNDPDEDGKFRYDEIKEHLDNDVLCLFDIRGALTAGLGGAFKIELGPFSYSKNAEIIPRFTILDFEHDCGSDDLILANVLDSGQLRLHMGRYAAYRDEGNKEENDIAEDFIISHVSSSDENEVITVSTLGVEQTYTLSSTILAWGENDDDIIELTPDIQTEARLVGGIGNDILKGGSNDDELFGDEQSNDNHDNEASDPGFDRLYGRGGNDNLVAGGKDDFLDGGEGADFLDGGEGTDTASYSSAKTGVLVNLATGEQTGDAAGDTYIFIEQLEGSEHNDTFIGNNRDDVFDGAGGDDTLKGGAGDDLLIGGAGADILEGGEGDDAVTYSTSETAVNINLATNTSSGGDAEGDILISIEHVEGTNNTEFGDVLVGNDQNNIFSGLRGDDIISGNGGDDFFYGDAGADTYDGGDGSDTISYELSQSGVTVNLATGEVSGGYAEGDQLVTIDDVVTIENIVATNFADTLIGNQADNTFTTGMGGDYIDGGEGNDLLVVDFSVADTGNIAISGSSEDTRYGPGRLLTLPVIDGSVYYSAQESITIRSIERIHLTATGQNDRFNSHSQANGDDILKAGAGDDYFRSYGGDDFIDGGEGNDTLESTSGNDEILAGTGDDTVSSGADDDIVEGGTGNDILNGGSGNDIINGGDDDDWVSVTLGDDDKLDQLDGGDGIDTLSADFSNQTVDIVVDETNPSEGYRFNDGSYFVNFERFDDLWTGSGNDRIVIETLLANNDFRTGAGDDVIIMPGQGDDYIDGGEGNDLLVVDFSVADTGDIAISGSSEDTRYGPGRLLTLPVIDGSVYYSAQESIAIRSIERIHLTATGQNDRFSSHSQSDGDDILKAGAGDDHFRSYGGDDFIDGGDGNDILETGLGSDQVEGGTGNDTIYLGNDTDRDIVAYSLGDGTDIVHNFTKDTNGDLLSFRDIPFIDVLTIGNNTQFHLSNGPSGNLAFGDGELLVSLTNISDFTSADLGTHIAATPGTQFRFTAEGPWIPAPTDENQDPTNPLPELNAPIIGTDNNDVLRGGDGIDSFFGGDGNDRFRDSSDRNLFNGGDGIDTVDLRPLSHGTTANLSQGFYTDETGTAIGNSLISIEKLYGTAFDDTLIGNTANNFFDGGDGIDTYQGGEGNDRFRDSSGRNFFDGGDGTDTVDFGKLNHGTTANLSQGFYTDETGTAIDNSLISIEKLHGTAFDDTLIGNTANNFFDGGDGIDTYQGGEGNDRFRDSSGRNFFDGGEGIDTVDLGKLSHGIIANLSQGFYTDETGTAIDNSLINIEKLHSTAFDDILIGNTVNNFFDGGDGIDTYQGGEGNDRFRDSSSRNFFDGGNGIDTVDLRRLNHGITADLNQGFYTDETGTAIDNSLISIEKLYGTAFNDTLNGNTANNYLNGGDGNDSLFNSEGTDTLLGGSGADTFILSSIDHGLARIRDFNNADGDIIQISQAGFDSSLALGVLDAEQFTLGTTANDASDRFIYDVTRSQLFFDADGTGTTRQIRIAQFTNNFALSHTDIVVV